jgi:2-keto-4-pentenoate hydratase/2-oxohepta-3-ene-1,7-dioic acid hydratase in catechol pathway
MRFHPHTAHGKSCLAVEHDGHVIELSALDEKFPHELDDVIAGGPKLLAAIAARLKVHKGKGNEIAKLVPRFPLARPGNVYCLGLNYAEHAKEGGHEVPTYPALFMRTRESLIAAGEPIVRPTQSERLDYEAELMIVVGKGGRRISEDKALEHVFGYTLFNDVSVRDYQRKTSQWTPGKNFDRTGPVGPVVVTADALPKGAEGLRIMTRLNGKTLQDDNTQNMIFPVATAIAAISEFATLKPGDLIATGTPQGVGHARKPPLWMKAGDTVEIEVAQVGILRNTIVDEKG